MEHYVSAQLLHTFCRVWYGVLFLCLLIFTYKCTFRFILLSLSLSLSEITYGCMHLCIRITFEYAVRYAWLISFVVLLFNKDKENQSFVYLFNFNRIYIEINTGYVCMCVGADILLISKALWNNMREQW